MKRLLSLREAADYISSTEGSVRTQLSCGTLPFPVVKNGRKTMVDKRDLDKWIDGLERFGPVTVGKEKPRP